LPGKTITDGLRLIETDSDTMVMMSMIDRVRNLVIYLDHNDMICSGINWDDIVANPVCSLPKVFSPVKVVTAERKEGEKLPVFYTNLRKATEWNQDPVHDGI